MLKYLAYSGDQTSPEQTPAGDIPDASAMSDLVRRCSDSLRNAFICNALYGLIKYTPQSPSYYRPRSTPSLARLNASHAHPVAVLQSDARLKAVYCPWAGSATVRCEAREACFAATAGRKAGLAPVYEQRSQSTSMTACPAVRCAHRILGSPRNSSTRGKGPCSRVCTPQRLHLSPSVAAAAAPGLTPHPAPATASGSGSGPRPPGRNSSWQGGGDGSSSSSGPSGGSSHHSALLLGGAGLLSWLADCSPAEAGSKNSVVASWDSTPTK
jgi:hypothetical protein